MELTGTTGYKPYDDLARNFLNLMYHIKITLKITEEPRFVCQTCARGYLDSTDFVLHISEIHSDFLPNISSDNLFYLDIENTVIFEQIPINP